MGNVYWINNIDVGVRIKFTCRNLINPFSIMLAFTLHTHCKVSRFCKPIYLNNFLIGHTYICEKNHTEMVRFHLTNIPLIKTVNENFIRSYFKTLIKNFANPIRNGLNEDRAKRSINCYGNVPKSDYFDASTVHRFKNKESTLLPPCLLKFQRSFSILTLWIEY